MIKSPIKTKILATKSKFGVRFFVITRSKRADIIGAVARIRTVVEIPVNFTAKTKQMLLNAIESEEAKSAFGWVNVISLELIAIIKSEEIKSVIPSQNKNSQPPIVLNLITLDQNS